jgi:hypothetical protein
VKAAGYKAADTASFGGYSGVKAMSNDDYGRYLANFYANLFTLGVYGAVRSFERGDYAQGLVGGAQSAAAIAQLANALYTDDRSSETPSGTQPPAEAEQVKVAEADLGELTEGARREIERRNVVKARADNARKIGELRLEASRKGTVEGVPIAGRDVIAFEFLKFRVDPATGQSALIGNFVVPEFVLPGAEIPRTPSTIMLEAGTGIRYEISSPVGVFCSSCKVPMQRTFPIR